MSFDDYAKAKRAGEKAFRRNLAAGQYPFLPALDEMLPDRKYLKEEHVGLVEIPVNLIAGTVTRGRQESFAGNFMPLLSIDSEFALKWTSLLKYQMEQGIADPVKVYEFLGRFYVLEGNKRVSVMKYLSNPDIPADVTRILPADSDAKEVRVYHEFLYFYRCTRQYEPMLSDPGAYEQLADIFMETLDRPWRDQNVRTLRSSYYRFTRMFEEQGGEELEIMPGDAFLLFLEVYSLQVLLEGSDSEIRKKLKRIWEEYRVKANREPIAFLKDPTIRRPRSPLKRILNRATGYAGIRTLKIAFIYDKDPADSRWLNGHERGRMSMEERFRSKVRTSVFPDCQTTEAFDAAVGQAVADGAKIVFTASPTQMHDTLRAAVQNPDVKFLNSSVHISHKAVRTYSSRLYEVKFLLGALAAALSEDHRLGYVSGIPLYGSIANINAFAIGAAMVDPKVEIRLFWSCMKDHAWREELKKAGLTIVSGPDLIHPGKDDNEYGLYRYDRNGANDGTGGKDAITRLAIPIRDWGRFYEILIQTIQAGAWEKEDGSAKDKALNYWWGMSSGVIDIGLSEQIPDSTRMLIEGLKKAVIEGIIHPFEGRLRSQEGIISADPKGRLSTVDIVTMEWLHDHVVGRIPTWDELTEIAQKAVRAGGIRVVAEK